MQHKQSCEPAHRMTSPQPTHDAESTNNVMRSSPPVQTEWPRTTVWKSLGMQLCSVRLGHFSNRAV